jgi:hypothetical protein
VWTACSLTRCDEVAPHAGSDKALVCVRAFNRVHGVSHLGRQGPARLRRWTALLNAADFFSQSQPDKLIDRNSFELRYLTCFLSQGTGKS